MADAALSGLQQQLLDFIREFVTTNRYPPTIRDIRKVLGIPSNATVSLRLDELSKGGLIYRNKRVARGIVLLAKPTRRIASARWFTRMPLLGRLDQASRPDTLKLSNLRYLKENIDLPRSLVADEEDLFAMQVRGESLHDALVADGDIAVMKRSGLARTGELVAVRFKREEKTLLKHLFVEADGRIRLEAANPNWKTIYTNRTNLEVLARVLLIVRRCERNW